MDLVFDVILDEAGNYCASTRTQHGSLFTDAPSLDQLLKMIADLLELYRQDTGENVEHITLRLPAPVSQAA